MRKYTNNVKYNNSETSDFNNAGYSRPYKRRRNYPSNNGSYMTKQIKSLNYKVNKLSKQVKPETKFTSIYIDNITMDVGGGVSGPLCVPNSGSGEQDRTGNSIYQKKLELKFTVVQNGSTETSVRVCVFLDKQNTITTGPQLWEYANNSGQAPILSPKNFGNYFNCKILYDQTFEVTGDHPLFIRYQDIPCKYFEQFEGSTTVKTNALKFAWIGVDSAGNGPHLAYTATVRYLDS